MLLWNKERTHRERGSMMVFLIILSCLVVTAALLYLLVCILNRILNHIGQEMVYTAIRKGTCPPLEDCRLQDNTEKF